MCIHDRHGSSVSFNKQNPSLFSFETKRHSNLRTTAEGHDTITFLLCPLCNQPYKKGRPLRAHLQSKKHSLSDNTIPSLADVIKDALQGVQIEGKLYLRHNRIPQSRLCRFNDTRGRHCHGNEAAENGVPKMKV